MREIEAFRQSLEKACRARDKSAHVSVFETFTTHMSGEYIATVLYDWGKEVYAFNPRSGAWIICYEV